MNIREIIAKIVSEYTGTSVAEVTDASTFQSLGADSLDEIEIVIAIEDETGAELPDEFWPGKTIGEIVAYCERARS